MAVLSDSELERALSSLAGWAVADGALHKRYEFPDFASALAYANRVGEAAEHANHHPDLLVTWGAVEVSWVNHAEGGISERDVEMARRSDELA
ncbi:MAG: 4a-hydroxytetrahydrobiopterin dehydratase [Gaiellales bacterium]